MVFHRTPIALAALTALLSAQAQTVAPPAAAASAAEARQTANAPQSVVVTGTRRALPASKVPFNISALTEEALREENIGDVKDLIQSLPAVNAPGNSARFADSVTVRGLNISPVNANNIEYFSRSTLAYYLDDTPLPNIGYRIKDVARVETLLGPQGTLYGAGSLGGTIRYITNRPVLGRAEGKLNTSLYQTAGGGLSNDTDGVINLPLGQSLALRAVLARLDEKGYTDRVSTPPWRSTPWSTKPDANRNVYADDDWQKVTSGRVSLLWRLSKGTELVFSHSQQDQLAHGTSGVSLMPLSIANARTPAERDAAWRDPGLGLGDLPCQPNCTYTDGYKTPVAVNDHSVLARYPEFADRKFRLSSIDLDVDLGFAQLHSSTSTFKDTRKGEGDYASQGWNFYYSFGDLGGDINSDRSAFISFDNSYKGVSHETRLTSKGDGPLSWIAGLYYTKQNRSLKFFEVLPGMDNYLGSDKASTSPIADAGYGEDLTSKYKETAFFGELSYCILPPWTVTVGARAFNYSDTGSVKIVDYAGGFVDNSFTSKKGENGRSFYKINSAYQFNDDLLGYATFSQGFRRGGTNGFKDIGGNTVAAEANQYKPDSTDNIELGLKGYLLNRDLYLEGNVYRINWKNTQTYRSQDVNFFPVNGTTNGPDARSQGLEIAARYRVNANWQLSYSGATTDAEWTATKEHCIYTDGSECRTWEKGGKLGGAPKWKHNLGVRFQTDLGNDLFLTSSLNARHIDKVRSDRSDSVADNEGVLVYPAYTLFNASVSVSRDKWDVQLWVQNLSNEKALVSNQAAGNVLGRRVIYTQPRTIGLNLSYAF